MTNKKEQILAAVGELIDFVAQENTENPGNVYIVEEIKISMRAHNLNPWETPTIKVYATGYDSERSHPYQYAWYIQDNGDIIADGV